MTSGAHMVDFSKGGHLPRQPLTQEIPRFNGYLVRLSHAAKYAWKAQLCSSFNVDYTDYFLPYLVTILLSLLKTRERADVPGCAGPPDNRVPDPHDAGGLGFDRPGGVLPYRCT
jgi:hypothetical protein